LYEESQSFFAMLCLASCVFDFLLYQALTDCSSGVIEEAEEGNKN